ncbi:hypothetical protein [Actinoplanes utahensis]|uniref:Uncharacterized protein n=1 Tax=Actinoplanes utahensis TaxID=1869 RepID=A0A0A6UBH8_ACTUT|nr:hypothetical protein [Actinoplanes utahensis]KHD73390.1 hypothetical protein MB27_34755 [Actinoplanes utahensis]
MNELHDALLTIAGRAHDPAPLATRIMTRSRNQRQRRSLLVAAAAAGTAAAGGIAAWPRRPAPPAPPATTAGLPSSPAPSLSPSPSAGPAAARATMLYRPTWMPTGYAETSRVATVPGTGPVAQTRSWLRGSDEEHPIHLFLGARTADSVTGMKPGTLGGRKAWLNPDGANPHQVSVEVGDGLILNVSVHQEKDRVEIARHVAASIRPDGQSAVAVSLSFGWLPENCGGPLQVDVNGTGRAYDQALRRRETGGEDRDAVEALLTSLTWPDRDAEKVTLRGRPGLLWAYEEAPCSSDSPAGSATSCGFRVPNAVVDLGGRRLHVRLMPWASKRREDLIRVVDEIRIGPAPDVSWLPR